MTMVSGSFYLFVVQITYFVDSLVFTEFGNGEIEWHRETG